MASDYRILTADSGFGLEKEVNEWISRGYKPSGSLSVKSGIYGNNEYCQAMIKEEE